MPAYAAALAPGGDLVMSGFLEADTAAVTQAAAKLGMETVAAETREDWMMIRVKKKK
jgi:ribosomal protein L11 methyltransferase